MICTACTYDVPIAMEQCPHCGRPALFPNVREVEQTHEVESIHERYRQVKADTARRGCADVAEAFESAISGSYAVITRPIEEALRLAKADNQGYASFWSLLNAGVRLPEGERWERLRAIADIELFGNNRDKVRYAALSLNGACLRQYGEVALQLEDRMIEHRATVFEENSAVFFERKRLRGGEDPPKITGHRALWTDRGKLALAKHGQQLSLSSTSAIFASILLRSGPTPEEDVFIEVHIWGSLTRRSLACVTIDVGARSPALAAELRNHLVDIGVRVMVR